MSLTDPRITKQASILVDYSIKLKKGENVLIQADFVARPLVLEIYKLLIKRGANEVKLSFSDYEFTEAYYKNAVSLQIKHFPQISWDEIKKIDCFVAISSPINTRGLTGLDVDKIAERRRVTDKIQNYRVDNTRWVITTYPTNAQAQEANMSLSDYEKFVFKAINGVDWKSQHKLQEKLRKRIDKTSVVRIVGKETDLSMSIKGRKAVNADGEYNMPDGEVFTSVIENSANGYITYTFPALYLGREFHNVRLKFKNGKVVTALAAKGGLDLNKILNTDSGARKIGELGFGNNFRISKFTKDILFDEKIGGTIHIALGDGYKETLSKNKSAIHWDMIKDLRRGGEIHFDDKIVQKNGKWLI